ncbi:MAG: hypothetical protein Q9M20_02325 [Mariprofundaceae bacterium]|nr:hypothetical protein [Mariprofundaceae bacterium]
MIRNIIVTLVFFFGPALLMLVLRNIFLYWKTRHFDSKQQGEDIIDITPVSPTAPSHFFIVTALLVGLISAYLVYGQLTSQGEKVDMKYIPAHINAQGDLVPEQYIPRP